jgi:hypothetical protein
MKKRHYRTRRNRFFIYPFSTAGVVICLLLVLVPRGGLVVHVGAAICVVLLLWLARNAGRMGLEVDPNGIHVHGPFKSEHVAWDNVVGLDTHRWSINEIIDVRLADGRTLNTSLVQGIPVSWHGGKTNDILSVLQTELRSRGTLASPLVGSQ